jgi:hypothetical protein
VNPLVVRPWSLATRRLFGPTTNDEWPATSPCLPSLSIHKLENHFPNRSNCYNFQFSKTKLQDFVDLFRVDLLIEQQSILNNDTRCTEKF